MKAIWKARQRGSSYPESLAQRSRHGAVAPHETHQEHTASLANRAIPVSIQVAAISARRSQLVRRQSPFAF